MKKNYLNEISVVCRHNTTVITENTVIYDLKIRKIFTVRLSYEINDLSKLRNLCKVYGENHLIAFFSVLIYIPVYLPYRK